MTWRWVLLGSGAACAVALAAGLARAPASPTDEAVAGCTTCDARHQRLADAEADGRTPGTALPGLDAVSE